MFCWRPDTRRQHSRQNLAVLPAKKNMESEKKTPKIRQLFSALVYLDIKNVDIMI